MEDKVKMLSETINVLEKEIADLYAKAKKAKGGS